MREIIFRGKRSDTGEWVEGDLIHGVNYKKGNVYILPVLNNLASIPGIDPLDGCLVIPETVGQFTGLTDMDRNKIFEGDIIFDGMYYYPIIYKAGCFGYISKDKSFITYSTGNKKVGNIFDNPELTQ